MALVLCGIQTKPLREKSLHRKVRRAEYDKLVKTLSKVTKKKRNLKQILDFETEICKTNLEIWSRSQRRPTSKIRDALFNPWTTGSRINLQRLFWNIMKTALNTCYVHQTSHRKDRNKTKDRLLLLPHYEERRAPESQFCPLTLHPTRLSDQWSESKSIRWPGILITQKLNWNKLQVSKQK